MDDPALDQAQHVAALRGLGRINRLSLADRSLWRPLAELARQLDRRQLRVLDVATGGGDNLLALWRRARGHGLQLEMHGVDISETALDFARQQAQACGAPARFSALDVLEGSLPGGYDIVMCSLFLHHLDDAQIAKLLAAMAAATERLVLVNDLVRCRAGLLLAYLATRLFSRSHVVWTDGPRSVRAALSTAEVQRLAEHAGLKDATLRTCWPYRFVLTWRKPPER